MIEQNLKDAEIEQFEADGFHVVREHRVYASISQLAHFTGRDRATVSDRVRELASLNGPKGSILYPVDLSLPAIRDRYR